MGDEADVLCSDTPGDEGICLNFAKKGNVGGVAKMDWYGNRWMGVACDPSKIVWSYVVVKSSYISVIAEVICLVFQIEQLIRIFQTRHLFMRLDIILE